METASYAIALGSNRRHGRYGPPPRILAAAIRVLRQEGLDVVAISPTCATPAMGGAGRSFANAAALVRTALEPPELLALLKSIEHRFGRRRGRRWGSRVLDLDILLWSGGIHADGALVIPHLGLAERDFVLRPLVGIAPAWRHPTTGLTVRQLRTRLLRPKLVDRSPPGA